MACQGYVVYSVQHNLMSVGHPRPYDQGFDLAYIAISTSDSKCFSQVSGACSIFQGLAPHTQIIVAFLDV